MEVWKVVVGYEGFYEVSSAGRVRSVDRIVPSGSNQIRLRGRLRALCKNPNGYFFVTLTKGGHPTTFYVHRLVVTAFVPNPLGYPQVAHMDGDSTNNCVANLQWSTSLLNNNQKTRYVATPKTPLNNPSPPKPSQEIWKAVVGYENFYEVSDGGRVRSLDHYVSHWRGGQRLVRGTLRYTPSLGAYPGVHLSKNGHTKMHTVHRLVAEAFLGPCPEGLEVAHNDGVPTNSRLENLRYATRSDNNKDKVRHGTHRKGTSVPTSKLTDEDVRKIRAALAEGQSKMSQARRFNVSHKTIRNIANNLIWNHVE